MAASKSNESVKIGCVAGCVEGEANGRRVSRRAFVKGAAGLGASLVIAGAAGSALADAASKESAASADGSKDSAVSSDATPTSENVVLDFKGREVAVPEKLERVAVTCMGGGTQTVCVLGAADRLVVSPSMAKSAPLLLKILPQLENVADAGTFDDVNLETLAAGDPQLVFVASTSDKGNQAIEDLGIATYTLGTANSTVESMRNDYVNAGKLLGTSDIADDLMEVWDEIMGFVDEKAASIPEAERLTVYRCSSELTSCNHTKWAGTWIEAAGGVPAAPEGTTGDVSIEQIAEWDPDVIITSADIATITGNDAYAELKAVKNGAVYNTPKGTMGWDIPSPEVPLGFVWLGKRLYPEAFADFDVEEETKAFYAKFYNYELTEEDLDGIFKR